MANNLSGWHSRIGGKFSYHIIPSAFSYGRRHTKFASRLHRETTEERLDIGEMPILAEEVLDLDDSTDYKAYAAQSLRGST